MRSSQAGIIDPGIVSEVLDLKLYHQYPEMFISRIIVVLLCHDSALPYSNIFNIKPNGDVHYMDKHY